MQEEYLEELESMREGLARARFGSFLIIPFRMPKAESDHWRLSELGEFSPIETSDISEAIKRSLRRGVMERWTISDVTLLDRFFPHAQGKVSLAVGCGGTDLPFRLGPSYIYTFMTGVVFFCLGIEYEDIRVLEAVTNLGFSENRATYCWADGAGVHPFSLADKLTELMALCGAEPFFPDSDLFLESFIFDLAVVPERFRYLKSLKALTFNLHQLLPLGVSMTDESEEDVCWAYSVKDQESGTYRWGCCVTSQTVNYVFANPALDLEAAFLSQAEDGLPLVLLALYQEYSCLYFTELLASADKRDLRGLRTLNRRMLEFRAYGTVHPAHISRWYNVRQIYSYLMKINGVEEAVGDIRDKLGILEEHRKERESGVSEAVMGLITIFGIVSILASLLTIAQILSGGSATYWILTVIATLVIALVAAIAVVWRKRQ